MAKKKKGTGRKVGKKCPKCTRYTTGGSGISAGWGRSRFAYTMNRIYVKNKNSWKSIGWHCKNCGYNIIGN